MNTIIAIVVMATVTYIIRVVPLVAIKDKIENKRIQRFLYFLPYTILTAMIVPSIITSTGFLPSAIVGTIVAILLGYLEKSLIVVSIGAVIAAYVVELLLHF